LGLAKVFELYHYFLIQKMAWGKKNTPAEALESTNNATFQADYAKEWSERIAGWSPEERIAKEKAFVRKIDFRLLPILVRTLLTFSFAQIAC
jgi:hypothetical protein